MAFKLSHLHMKTPDPDKTSQWYVDNLGATIIEKIGPADSPIGFRMDLHGLTLNVTKFVPGQVLEQHYGMEHFAVDTDEINQVMATMKESGARLLEERKTADGRKICFYEGPDGVRMEVIEAAP